MIRVESLGSIWELDLDDMRYRRFPKQESPRERPEWSDERAGALQDIVWHEMRERPYVAHPGPLARLVIPVPVAANGTDCVTAPLGPTESDRLVAALEEAPK